MSTYSQASTAHSAVGYSMVEQGASIDQDGRQTWVQVFEGNQSGIDTLRISFGGGVIVNTQFVPGGRSRLTAIWPYNPASTETPVDVWDYDESATQPSIWTKPEVAAVLTSAYKSAIEDALKVNGANPYGTATSGTDAIFRNVYDRLLRGTEGWESNKPFIRRIRSFSGSYGSPATLTVTSTVYSRSSLISTWSVPSDFQPRIPVNPSWTAPSQTTWGWRKGPQSSSYNRATRRWEETTTFEGNFWDNFLYSFV